MLVSATVPLACTVTVSPLATSAPVPWTTVRRVVAYPGIGAKADMRTGGEEWGRRRTTAALDDESTARWSRRW